MKRENRAKRIAAILALAMALVFAMAVTAFGTDTALTIDSTTPKDGDTGMAIENMGVKVFFSEPVFDKDNAPGNIGKCSMKDENGEKVPTQVIFSEKEPNVMLVLADPNNVNTKIEGKTEYTLTIEEGFTAASGNVLAKTETVSFTTLNPRNSMMGGMIFFGMRDSKKKAEEAKGAKKKTYEPVNPYKEAKRTGKSVDEIVAEEKKKKEKFEAKEAKEAAKKARHEKEDKNEIADGNLRVSRPRPISEAGSKYKAPRS